MRLFARVALAAMACVSLTTLAQAKVRITVDLDAQTMHVEAKDQVFDWKVSSGKSGYETPAGTYGVLWMDKDHRSEEYDNAPMPNAIFFAPGYAIHGAYKSAFGHPASHGCVRLPVAKSAILFNLVKAQGAEVTIVGDSPAVPPDVVATSKRRGRDDGYDTTYDAPDRYRSARRERDGSAAPDYYDDRGYRDPPAARYQPQPPPASESLFGSIY